MSELRVSKSDLEKMLRRGAKVDASVREIIKLHGDASYRTYYRAILADGKTFILMQMPEGKASVSEEITNFNGTHQELPYINVARYLKGHGINVAEIYHYSEKDHLMIIQDLGDQLMARLVEDADDEVRRRWYKKAVDLLVFLQAQTSGSSKFECVALQRSFDTALYNWEFDHFLEYGVEERTGQEMKTPDKELFMELTRRISEEISKLQYGFTHRDYQSRNILLVDSELYLIDFQDALLGPAAYDLVSLLRDSYVMLSGPLLSELLAYYCEKKNFDLASFRKHFDMVTCQRKLKDAGRFVFIDRVKKNPAFLKYVPVSLGYVREAMERLPEYQTLYDMLKKYIPEWQ